MISCSLSLRLSFNLLQWLYNLYGLGCFIHDHRNTLSVYARYVYVLVCVCLCALGRPLECDSRPAQWQETPWRLWQAASCTPSFRFLSHTHFFSLCCSSISTYITSFPLLHLYSLHSYCTCLFVFPFHSSSLHFLSGSQRDLNNWTFCTFVCTFYASQQISLSFFGLCFSLVSSSLCILCLCCDVRCPSSDPYGSL